MKKKTVNRRAAAETRSAMAFRKGKAAYNANEKLLHNPFAVGSVSAYAWMKGSGSKACASTANQPSADHQEGASP